MYAITLNRNVYDIGAPSAVGFKVRLLTKPQVCQPFYASPTKFGHCLSIVTCTVADKDTVCLWQVVALLVSVLGVLEPRDTETSECRYYILFIRWAVARTGCSQCGMQYRLRELCDYNTY